MRVKRGLAGLLVVAALAGGFPGTSASAAELPSRPGSSGHTAAPSRLRTITLTTPLVQKGMLGTETFRDGAAIRSRVLLPRGYERHPHRQWPLLVLLHGAGGSADSSGSWLAEGDVRRITADLPAIVVLPEGGKVGMYMNWQGGSSNPPSWETFHMTRLLDAVTQRFRVREGRRWHAVAGFSMGGQGALRYAEKYPQYFGSVAAFSPAAPDLKSPEVYGVYPAIVSAAAGRPVMHADTYGPFDGPVLAGNNPIEIEQNLRHTRIYVASGDGVPCVASDADPDLAVNAVVEAGLRIQAGNFSSSLRRHGMRVREVETCGVHNWTIWQRYLADAQTRWGLFRTVPAAPTRWTFDTTEKSGVAWQVSYEFARPPSAITRLRRSGDRLTVGGPGAVRLTYRGTSCVVSAPVTVRLSSLCR